MFERRSKQPRTEALAEGCQPVKKLRRGRHRYTIPARGDFMEQIAAKGVELASNAVVFVSIKPQVTQRIEMQTQNGLRLQLRPFVLAFTKRLRDPQQPIGHALHR